MKLSKDQFVGALEQSYDYASARALAPEFLTAAGLEVATEYDGAAVERICAVLAAQPRHARVLESIAAMTGIGPKPAAPAAAQSDDKKAAADKAAADKAAADKAAADKAAADKAAADKAAADKAAADKGGDKKGEDKKGEDKKGGDKKGGDKKE